MSDHESVGSGYDPFAVGHERVGRATSPSVLAARCPRCQRVNVPKCGKPNGYCLRCDDQTSYDYCSPR